LFAFPVGLQPWEIDMQDTKRRTRGKSQKSLDLIDAATKKADPRHTWFVGRYGSRCWELDAMDPNLLRERVRESIEALIDVDAWSRSIDVEAVEVDSMQEFHRAWAASISGQDAKYSEVSR
jgi:hypothetical protein